MFSYLESLTLRLAVAVADLPAATRRRHGDFLRRAQREDGGFAGREGGSDLYYTGFALRGLAILGLLDGPVAERAVGFLRARLSREESIVDFYSLIYGAKLIEAAEGTDVFAHSANGWGDAVASALEELRRPDGGYAKGRGGTASSTYHSFLVVLCLELIQRTVPEPDKLVEFVRSQASDGGGFREIRVSKRAGTNPTAAAIGTLQILDALDESTRTQTTRFLAQMQVDEGGLRANTRIPIADTLSTFTGVLTLLDLTAPEDVIDWRAARRFVESLENAEGGFLGAEWDMACDVEYTFYGLASLALLRNQTG